MTLRQVDGARGDIYGVVDELETVRLMLARLPGRAYVSRTLLMATASSWALVGAVALFAVR